MLTPLDNLFGSMLTPSPAISFRFWFIWWYSPKDEKCPENQN